MKPNACFRVSVDEIAGDVAKFVDLARTRTFEIWDNGKAEVLLVRIDAVLDWHDRLQISVPTTLLTDEEREALLKTPFWRYGPGDRDAVGRRGHLTFECCLDDHHTSSNRSAQIKP